MGLIPALMVGSYASSSWQDEHPIDNGLMVAPADGSTPPRTVGQSDAELEAAIAEVVQEDGSYGDQILTDRPVYTYLADAFQSLGGSVPHAYYR